MNKVIISALILGISSTLFAVSDAERERDIRELNEAEGFQYIGETRRPIKLSNGIHMHGWIYNRVLDVAIIQYTYPGSLSDTHKNNMAMQIKEKWDGSLGLVFKKRGFKDLAIMITETKYFVVPKTRIYSSRHSGWFKMDDYLNLDF